MLFDGDYPIIPFIEEEAWNIKRKGSILHESFSKGGEQGIAIR